MSTFKPSQKATYCQVQKFEGNEGLTYFFQVAATDKPDDVCIVPLDEKKFRDAYLEVRRLFEDHRNEPFVLELAREFHKAATDGKALNEKLAEEQRVQDEIARRQNARVRWVEEQYRKSSEPSTSGQRLDIRA